MTPTEVGRSGCEEQFDGLGVCWGVWILGYEFSKAVPDAS